MVVAIANRDDQAERPLVVQEWKGMGMYPGRMDPLGELPLDIEQAWKESR